MAVTERRIHVKVRVKRKSNNLNPFPTAIEGGGDTDTTAAMAGAIVGAHIGLEGIPTIFSEKLHDKDCWNYNDLTKLGDQLFILIIQGRACYHYAL